MAFPRDDDIGYANNELMLQQSAVLYKSSRLLKNITLLANLIILHNRLGNEYFLLYNQ